MALPIFQVDAFTDVPYCLAPYWAPRFGKPELIGYQASPRGGIVRTRLADSRVILGGKAITVLRGKWL